MAEIFVVVLDTVYIHASEAPPWIGWGISHISWPFGAHFTQIPTFRFPVMAPEKLVFRKLDNCDFEISFSFYFHVKELARSWSTVQKSSKSVHGARRTIKNKIFHVAMFTFLRVLLLLLSAVKQKEGNVNIATWKILFLTVLRAPWTDFDDFWSVD